MKQTQPVAGLAILLIGVSAAAVSFVFIRESTEPPVLLAAWRVLLAAILLWPLYYRDCHRGQSLSWPVWQRSLLPGCILSLHFIAWVIGARMTTGANATLLVNLMPLVMPLLMWACYQERPHRREVIATLIAVIGLVILFVDDFTLHRELLVGDAVCLLSMALFAAYLACARQHRSLPSIWVYVVPVYAVSGVVTLVIAGLLGSSSQLRDPYNLLMVVLLSVVSTVVGHTALNYAMQRLRGQTVSIVNLAQVGIAAAVGAWLYEEFPSPRFLLACSLLLLASLLVITHQSRIKY